MKKIKIISFYLLAIFIFEAAAQKPLEPVSLHLKYIHQFQFAGYYAAKIKGFYESEGLNVDIVQSNLKDHTIYSVLDGKYTFGVASSELVLEKLNKKSIVAIAAICQTSPYVIITKTSSNLKKPADLIGKKLTVAADLDIAEVKGIFIREGINLKSIDFKPNSWALQNLIDDKVDGIIGYISGENNILKSMNISTTLIKPEDYGINVYGDILFTSEKEVKKDPGKVERFKRASIKGWEYAFNHVEEIVDYILSLNGVKERGVTKEVLLSEAALLKDLVLPGKIEIGNMNEGRWEKIAGIYKELGMFSGEINLDGFVFNPTQIEQKQSFSLVIIILSLVVVVLFIAFLWVFQLRKTVTNRTKELIAEIEQRKQTEKLLQQEKNFFTNIMDNIPDAIYFKDITSKFIRINKATAVGFGLNNPEDANNKTDFDFFNENHAKQAFLDEQLLLTTGLPIINKEEKEIRADGRVTWASTTKMPFVDEHGKITGTFGISRDITERKNAEALLIRSERKFKSIFESSLDAICLIDKGKFIECNSMASKVFGVDIETLSNSYPSDFSPELQADGVRSIDKANEKIELALNGEAQFFEWLHTKGDGTIFVSEVSLNRIEIDGRILVQAIIRDITDRKNNEESIYKYFEIFQHIKMGVAVADIKNRISMVNPYFLDIFAYSSPEELQSQKISTLFVNEQHYNILAGEVEKKSYSFIETQCKNKEGEVFPAQVDMAIVRDDVGAPLFVILNIQDITSRKESERIQDVLYKISESVNTTDDISTLYKNIHDIIKQLMPAENFYIALFDEDSNYLTFPYFVDQYDSPPKPRTPERGLTEYIIRTGKDLLVDPKLDFELRRLGEVELVGEPSKIWLGVVLKSGDKNFGAIVLQDYHNADTYGEKEKQVLVFVSEQIALAIDKKRKEERLKLYAEELKELNANKDKFFSIIAHDLRSPFFSLLAISELLTNEFNSMDKDELENLIRELDKALKGSYKLLENLLEWSRLQTGRMKYQPSNQFLYEEVNAIADLMKPNMIRKNLNWTINIDRDIQIYADNNMFHSILQNLISNSVKFSNAGNMITVEATRDKTHVTIAVKDTGVGIREADKSKIFKIDQQHSTTGTAQERGTGLGLILCKELVEKNGGRIWLESEFGKGSTFSFTMPLVQ